MTLPPETIALLIGLAVATVTDLRDGKIYNWTTASMMALGLAIHATQGDWTFAVYGLVSAFVIHFTLFALGVEKGGDAKLMMGLGALCGPHLLLEATLWYAVLYLPVGLMILTASGKLPTMISHLRYVADKAQGNATGDAPPTTLLRTAPVIAAASAMSLLTDWLRFTGLT